MLRALWFIVKVALLVAAAVWVADRPGTLHLSWLDYEIDVQVGFALLCLLLFMLLTLMIHRALIGIAGLKRRWDARRERRKTARGLRALALGYGAIAAGDAKIAAYQAHRARLLLPADRGMAVLLDAQAARLRGDKAAALSHYESLLDDKDTAFLGLRGLIAAAAETGDVNTALKHAQKARQLYPQAPWIMRTLYALEVRSQAWDSAWRTLAAAERRRLIDKETATSDRIALHVAQADDAAHRDDRATENAHLKRAYKLDPAFVPVAARLARQALDAKHRKDAVKIIEKAWRQNPHPELAALWNDAAPHNKPFDSLTRLRWTEKLLALTPDNVEAHLAAAQVAGEDRLWAEARQHLVAAERLHPTARLYRLWAACEDAQGHFNEGHRHRDLAETAAPDKVWTCRETGRIYERWSPVAEPHGAFNTIVWGDPHPGLAETLPGDLMELPDSPAALPALKRG
jgi:HemY protein